MDVSARTDDLFGRAEAMPARDPVGPHFRPADLLHARERTMAAVHAVAAALQPGMEQRQAQRTARAVLKAMGAERCWHTPLVRFGTQTVQTFHDRTDPSHVLRDDDLFWVDLGAVWRGHEGDAGASFVRGHHPVGEELAATAQALWQATHARWRDDPTSSGQSLYAFLHAQARARGVIALPQVRGHRVGDWPHGRYVRGPLAALQRPPAAGLWVLEVHITLPDGSLGAFFEQSLM